MSANTVTLIVFMLLGLTSIVGGLLNIVFPNMWWWWEEFKMRMKGIEAKQNSNYVLWQRIRGVIAIIIGFILIGVSIVFFIGFKP